MGWAAAHIEKLAAGETVSFRPTGNSMVPKIRSKQLVTVEPVALDAIAVGDVVLCRVKGSEYLHNVLAIDSPGGRLRFQIGNNRGGINGWTAAVFGRLVKVED